VAFTAHAEPNNVSPNQEYTSPNNDVYLTVNNEGPYEGQNWPDGEYQHVCEGIGGLLGFDI